MVEEPWQFCLRVFESVRHCGEGELLEGEHSILVDVKHFENVLAEVFQFLVIGAWRTLTRQLLELIVVDYAISKTNIEILQSQCKLNDSAW